MKVVVSVPGPGRMRHAWWYGAPGDELAERDVAEVERVRLTGRAVRQPSAATMSGTTRGGAVW